MKQGILLYKLKAMGPNGSGLAWFESYLTNRKQLVEVMGTMTDFCKIMCSVPQSSILGPFIFVCYCSDTETTLKCTLLLDAGDSVFI